MGLKEGYSFIAFAYLAVCQTMLDYLEEGWTPFAII